MTMPINPVIYIKEMNNRETRRFRLIWIAFSILSCKLREDISNFIIENYEIKRQENFFRSLHL